MFFDFLDVLYNNVILKLISFLKSDVIKNEIFMGIGSLWDFILAFIIIALIIKFVLSPVRLSSSGIGFINRHLDDRNTEDSNG